MKLLRTYPDVEHLIVDRLADEMTGCSVGVGVPDDWTRAAGTHLQVNVDVTVTVHPIAAESTVRLTAWDESTTAAKALVQEAAARLLADPGDHIVRIRSGAGLLTARDTEHEAELATVTVLVTTRSIELGS